MKLDKHRWELSNQPSHYIQNKLYMKPAELAGSLTCAIKCSYKVQSSSWISALYRRVEDTDTQVSVILPVTWFTGFWSYIFLAYNKMFHHENYFKFSKTKMFESNKKPSGFSSVWLGWHTNRQWLKSQNAVLFLFILFIYFPLFIIVLFFHVTPDVAPCLYEYEIRFFQTIKSALRTFVLEPKKRQRNHLLLLEKWAWPHADLSTGLL